MKNKRTFLILSATGIFIVVLGGLFFTFAPAKYEPFVSHTQEVTLPTAGYSQNEPYTLSDTCFNESIDSALARLKKAESENDYSIGFLENFTQSILQLNDSTAVRMESVSRETWESFPVCTITLNHDMNDLSSIKLEDSLITLYPHDTTAIEYRSHGELEDIEDITGWEKYEYEGRIPVLNMWQINCGVGESTAAYFWLDFVHCKTGKTIEFGNEPILSPDSLHLFEYYINEHERENYISVLSLKDGKRYYLNFPESTSLSRAEWISDSTLKVQVEPLFYGYDDPQTKCDLKAISYRIYHFRPFFC